MVIELHTETGADQRVTEIWVWVGAAAQPLIARMLTDAICPSYGPT